MPQPSFPPRTQATGLTQGWMAVVIFYLIVWILCVSPRSLGRPAPSSSPAPRAPRSVASFHLYVTVEVLRAGKKGAILRFVLFLECGTGAETLREGMRLLALISPDSYGPGKLHTFEIVDQVLLIFAASGALVGAMCQGLMWIEFIMASQRMASVGHDLKLSAKILNISMIGYVSLCVIFTIMYLAFTVNGYTLWLFTTAVRVHARTACPSLQPWPALAPSPSPPAARL